MPLCRCQAGLSDPDGNAIELMQINPTSPPRRWPTQLDDVVITGRVSGRTRAVSGQIRRLPDVGGAIPDED